MKWLWALGWDDIHNSITALPFKSKEVILTLCKSKLYITPSGIPRLPLWWQITSPSTIKSCNTKSEYFDSDSLLGWGRASGCSNLCQLAVVDTKPHGSWELAEHRCTPAHPTSLLPLCMPRLGWVAVGADYAALWQLRSSVCQGYSQLGIEGQILFILHNMKGTENKGERLLALYL